jgi:hypothetical protein
LFAPLSRFIELRSFMETERPPESSLGLFILLPLESLLMLFCRACELRARLNPALEAAGLVFIVNVMFLSSLM